MHEKDATRASINQVIELDTTNLQGPAVAWLLQSLAIRQEGNHFAYSSIISRWCRIMQAAFRLILLGDCI